MDILTINTDPTIAIDNLNGAFSPTITGHKHDDTTGNGPKILGSNINGTVSSSENVTSTINGKNIYDIFELDGLTVKNVTNYIGYNFSMEYDQNSDGIPDSWEWIPSTGRTGVLDTTSVEGTYSFLITSDGSSNSGGKINTSLILINNIVNNYFIQFALWGTAGMQNLVDVLFYDSDKSLISTVNIYTSVANSTSPIIFINRMPPIPLTARYCKISFTGGNNTTAGTVRIDAFNVFSALAGIPNVSLASFSEIFKTGGSYVTAKTWTLLTTASGYRLGYYPMIITVDCEMHLNQDSPAPGCDCRLKCGSIVGSNNHLPATLTYSTLNPSITIDSTMQGPLILELQYKPSGSDRAYIRKTTTTSVISTTYW